MNSNGSDLLYDFIHQSKLVVLCKYTNASDLKSIYCYWLLNPGIINFKTQHLHQCHLFNDKCGPLWNFFHKSSNMVSECLLTVTYVCEEVVFCWESLWQGKAAHLQIIHLEWGFKSCKNMVISLNIKIIVDFIPQSSKFIKIPPSSGIVVIVRQPH